MIKHDYKPQSNQKLLKNPFQMNIPEWLTHPYLIIGMAVSILLLGIVLSLPDSQSEIPVVIEELKESVRQEVLEVESGTESEAVYGEPIDIQLELKSAVV